MHRALRQKWGQFGVTLEQKHRGELYQTGCETCILNNGVTEKVWHWAMSNHWNNHKLHIFISLWILFTVPCYFFSIVATSSGTQQKKMRNHSSSCNTDSVAHNANHCIQKWTIRANMLFIHFHCRWMWSLDRNRWQLLLHRRSGHSFVSKMRGYNSSSELH